MYQTMKKTMLPLAMLAICTGLVFTACKKENNTTEEVQAQLDIAKQFLQANNAVVSGSVEMSQGAEKHASGGLAPEGEERCGSVTSTPADPLAFPKSILFNYGTGCTDWAGVTRSGAFTLQLDKIWEAGTTTSVAYDQFMENGVLLNGSVGFSNLSDSLGFGFNFKATNLVRVEANGEQSGVGADLTFKQTVGVITFWDWQDDVYNITGSSNYTLANGETGSFAITEPLKKNNNCQWVSKGKAQLTWNGVLMDIDYGNGDCDNKATVTINGVQYEITL
jgi:hypothetical protein